MQYSSNNNTKNKGFYVILGLCLVAVFVASYLAVTKNSTPKSKSNGEVVNIKPDDSYTVNENADNVIDDKADNTESKPESANESTTPEVPAEPVKQTFVMPVKGKIIKQFSDKTLQYDKTFGDMRMHKGTDIACKKNENIVSATSGTVLDISETADYATVVTIDHGNGFTAKYCGLGSVSDKKGDTVNTGDLIGTATVPPSECMDECHIHIVCLKDGVEFDPISLYKETVKQN